MHPATRADVAGGVLIAILGVAVAIISRDFAWFGEGGRVGSGLVAGGAGVIMSVLGVFIAFKARVAGEAVIDSSPQQQPDSFPVPEVDGGPDSRPVLPVEDDERPRDPKSTAGVLLATFGAIFLTPRIGFLAACALLLLFIVVVLERTKVWTALVFTAVTVGVTWLVFVYGLEVPLPSGVLGPR